MRVFTHTDTPHTQKDGTDSITSTTDAEGNYYVLHRLTGVVIADVTGCGDIAAGSQLNKDGIR